MGIATSDSIVKSRFYPSGRECGRRQHELVALLKRIVAVGVALAVTALAYALWYAWTPLQVRALPVEFEIKAGSGFRGAAEQLEQAGIEVHRVSFEVLARVLGVASSVKAGTYEVTKRHTPLELLDRLARGDVIQVDLKLLEGWTIRQLRSAVDASPFLRHETQNMNDRELLERLGATEAHAEGLFYPDTYRFAKGSSDLALLRRAYQAMQSHLQQEWKARAPDVPYRTPYEALIMASIIEKETGRAEERELIAGVLVNRLRIGMRLQADPTVIYGLGEEFDGNLRKVHLLEDGPYNSYTRAGLPPTPISMPGLASLHAALQPAKTSALYYVSRGDGSSMFSSSLEEHNRAVDKFQRAPARKK